MSANANELIQTETIVLDMNATSRQDCLEQLAARMEAGQYVTDRALFLADVEAREQHASTAIGFGVAIPHGKSAGVVKRGWHSPGYPGRSIGTRLTGSRCH